MRNFFISLTLLWAVSCGSPTAPNRDAMPTGSPAPIASPLPSRSPALPNLQSELLNGENTATASPIGSFDFENYTYELPRGWQNPDGTTELTLTDGRTPPVSTHTTANMDDEAKAVAKSQRRIGLKHVVTKYFDVTGDGQDEAVVVLKVETEGAAIPQLVYVFEWKKDGPELLWPFRTGDRADGGLKSLGAENGQFVVELYGQDRFLLGQTETGRITDDVEQLCCPTHFTRSVYKWNGKNFLMQGKRLTFSVADPAAPPIENLGDKLDTKNKPKK